MENTTLSETERKDISELRAALAQAKLELGDRVITQERISQEIVVAKNNVIGLEHRLMERIKGIAAAHDIKIGPEGHVFNLEKMEFKEAK